MRERAVLGNNVHTGVSRRERERERERERDLLGRKRQRVVVS